MKVTTATIEDITLIQEIANKTWINTYQNIISKEQINYMLEMMYSEASLREQMTVLNHHFLLIKQAEFSDNKGFVSFEFDYKNMPITKLHKLYVVPESQGFGLGRTLIEAVCNHAKTYGNSAVRLNMNRDNQALDFYKCIGFDIIGEEDIDIGSGYLMEDYIFEKTL